MRKLACGSIKSPVKNINVRSTKLAKLEAIRGAAAVYVVVHHAQIADHGPLKVALSFGQEAVIVFFVLSGFVIYYSTFSRNAPPSARVYIVHRLRRIFPLFLMSILFALAALVFIQRSAVNLPWKNVLGNVLMLQDVSSLKRGVWFDTLTDNSPLWSLSYEWWFYLLFLAILKWGWGRRPATFWSVLLFSCAAALTYAVFPNQACLFAGYFFIWWVGAELAREYVDHQTFRFRSQAKVLIGLAILLCAWSANFLVARHLVTLRPGTDPILQLRHVGAALALLAVGFIWHHARYRGFSIFLAPFALFAPISFALYIFHYPLLSLAAAFLPQVNPVFRLLLILPPLLILCYFLEIRLQPKLNAIISKALLPAQDVIK